jgi:hypothetical protein
MAPTSKSNLHAKIASAQAAINLGKDKTVRVKTRSGESYTYDYVTEGAICNAIRRELSAAGVALYTSNRVISHEGNMATARVEISFVDAESGEIYTISGENVGTDTADKAVSKAITTAYRVTLCKQFLQAGELDPEEEHIEREAPKPRTLEPKKPANGRTDWQRVFRDHFKAAGKEGEFEAWWKIHNMDPPSRLQELLVIAEAKAKLGATEEQPA